MHDSIVAPAPLDEIDERHLVNDGLGIGHHDDCGHSAGCSGVTRGLEAFAVLLTGFAGEHLGVYQAGSKHVIAAGDDGGAVGSVPPQMPAEVGNHTVAHQQAAGLVAAGGRVDNACVDEDRVAGRVSRDHFRRHWQPH